MSALTQEEQKARIRQLQTDAILNGLEILKRAQDIRVAPVTLFSREPAPAPPSLASNGSADAITG